MGKRFAWTTKAKTIDEHEFRHAKHNRADQGMLKVK